MLLLIENLPAQYPWPVTPFTQSQEITGTFCEYRDTGDADHFHNGVDIPKPDGSPVYPVQNGTVTDVVRSGSDAYVRVGNFCYLHIQPNPSLDVGDAVVASQSILGTILPGQGHVHFIDGTYDSEINPLRPGGGLTPYEDSFPPIIRWVRFYVNSTDTQFPSNIVSGRVDLVVKVDEQNGPLSSPLSRQNNGTYEVGYKILSADTATVIYQPPNGGVRFRFTSKPNNRYAHNVYCDWLASTSSHVYIVTNDIYRDNFWDTSRLSQGNYVVMIFTADTRGNTDTSYVAVTVSDQDLLPPAQPVLKYVKETGSGFAIAWYPNTEVDLAGYRLYYSYDNLTWILRYNESVLGKSSTGVDFNTQLSRDLYFRLTAVDQSSFRNESSASDVYGIRPGQSSPKILLVDGFDRIEDSGSWHDPAHFFAFTHGRAIAANDGSFDTGANDAVIDGNVTLNDYEAVVWILGDESSANKTFSLAEQDKVKFYLENGGNLFVSGSEAAWDLDTNSGSYGATPADEDFLHHYLKADYAGDDAGIYTVTGVGGTIFAGISLSYGSSPYLEDWPDYVNPYGGSIINLRYDVTKNAGIQYEGTFGAGTKPGKLVYIGFPFETITREEHRNEVIKRVLEFFFPVSAVETQTADSPSRFALLQNYPNPFNSATVIEYELSKRAHVKLSVFNTLGQLVAGLVDKAQEPGHYQVHWDGCNLAGQRVSTGIYFCFLQAGEYREVKRMVLAN